VHEIALTLCLPDGTCEPLTFNCRHMYNAAFAGRDPKDVQHHIDEMHALGVAPPDRFPLLAPVSPHLLSIADQLGLYTDSESPDTTSGEVEYVLLWQGGEIYVGVGSDHCDLELEKTDLVWSKNVALNLISDQVWRLGDVVSHFDDLMLRCEVRNGAEWRVSQNAPCGTLLSPDFWIAIMENSLPDTDGTVLFSGTIGSLDGVQSGTGYSISLTDPVTGRSLTHAYTCQPTNLPMVPRPEEARD